MNQKNSRFRSSFFFSSLAKKKQKTFQEHVGGAMVETTGLRFAPSLLSIMLSAFEGRAEGVNFEPRLIYIQVRESEGVRRGSELGGDGGRRAFSLWLLARKVEGQREGESNFFPVNFRFLSTHFLTSSFENKKKLIISADGRECPTARSKRSGAFFYLCFYLGRTKREMNAKKCLIFCLFQLTFADHKRISFTSENNNNSPRSSTLVLWVPMCSLRELTFRCVVVFFSLFFCCPFLSLFFSLFPRRPPHLFLPRFSLPPLQNKNTAYPRLCDAYGGKSFSRFGEKEKEAESAGK